jgi:hypothetical protein
LSDNENVEKMSAEDVMDVMSMAQSIYTAGNIFGVFTPSLLNKNLNSLNNNAVVPTESSLDYALKNYKISAETLQAYSEFAQVYDPIYGRAIDYYVGLMAFDLDEPKCKNIYRKEEYTSKDFLDDQRRIDKFFDNFDYKAEFRKVVANCLRNEIYYTWFRDSEGTFDSTGEIELDDDGNVKSKKRSTYTLQMMPQDYCKVTGQWENGLLFDFDMYYFLKAGVDLNSYDPIFKKYYKEMFDEKSNTPHYNPTAQLDSRDGTFALWTQTSPEDGAWCWKFNMSNLNNTPKMSSLIKQVITNSEIEKLQKDKYMLEAHALLAGDLGMMNKQQSGQVKDATALGSKTLANFLKLVKMGLQENINAVAMPTENTKFYQFENKNPDMYSNQLKITSANGASASNLLYDTDKTSQFELQSQIITDYNLIAKMYDQFSTFLNYYVNKKTRKYKFEFKVSGCSHPFIRETVKKNLLDLANLGIVLSAGDYSKIVDMTPTEFKRSLKQGKYSGWTDELLSQLVSVHTQNAKATNTSEGRPVQSDNNLTDGGSTARDYKKS